MLRLIVKHSCDERNFVKKTVNLALRNIGKSGFKYYKIALKTARTLEKTGSKTAKWIAKDAIREFIKPAIIKRAKQREKIFATALKKGKK